MLGRVVVTLAIVAVLVGIAYFLGGAANFQVNGQAPSLSGVFQGSDLDHYIDSYAGGLKHQALWVSVADNAFSFQVSWLGLILVVAVLLFFRLLRRRR